MARLKGGFLAGLLTIGLAIAAYTQPWYSIETSPSSPNDLDPHLLQLFKWTNVTTQRLDPPNNPALSSYPQTNSYSDLKMPTVAATFNSCLSFLTIGLAIAAVLVVGQFIVIFMVKRKLSSIFKGLLVLVSLVVTAMLAVSFFTLMNLPPAFSQDKQCQNSNAASSTTGTGGQGNLWCQTFKGQQTLSGTDTILVGAGGDVTYIWGPAIGWWLCLGALASSLIAAAGTFMTHR